MSAPTLLGAPRDRWVADIDVLDGRAELEAEWGADSALSADVDDREYSASCYENMYALRRAADLLRVVLGLVPVPRDVLTAVLMPGDVATIEELAAHMAAQVDARLADGWRPEVSL